LLAAISLGVLLPTTNGLRTKRHRDDLVFTVFTRGDLTFCKTFNAGSAAEIGDSRDERHTGTFNQVIL